MSAKVETSESETNTGSGPKAELRALFDRIDHLPLRRQTDPLSPLSRFCSLGIGGLLGGGRIGVPTRPVSGGAKA